MKSNTLSDSEIAREWAATVIDQYRYLVVPGKRRHWQQRKGSAWMDCAVAFPQKAVFLFLTTLKNAGCPVTISAARLRNVLWLARLELLEGGHV
ncbi:MAG TPA: hypothetical protein VKU00_19915 [Chthonomonadaceae bacterium]|nr:hypothetical protein [Chthonomonadaceae bacterium]